MDPLHEEAPAPDPILHAKADVGRRLLAYLIDAILAGIAGAVLGLFSSALGTVVTAGYMLVRDGLALDFMDHRSIGKRVMNLRPVRLDGKPMDLEASMRRNWMFVIGSLAQLTFRFGLGWIVSLAGALIVVYELYRVLTDPAGRRWGDELAGTQVVDATA